MTTETQTAPTKNGTKPDGSDASDAWGVKFTNPSEQYIERASIHALVEKAELETARHFRAIDEYNSAATKDLQALQQRIKDLQQEHQQKNDEWGKWELANRARIDGLKQSLGEQKAE